MKHSVANTLVTAATFLSTALTAIAVNAPPAAAAKSRAMLNGYYALDQSRPLPTRPLPDGIYGVGGTVIIGGSVIGADPDENIRFQIMREFDSVQ